MEKTGFYYNKEARAAWSEFDIVRLQKEVDLVAPGKKWWQMEWKKGLLLHAAVRAKRLDLIQDLSPEVVKDHWPHAKEYEGFLEVMMRVGCPLDGVLQKYKEGFWFGRSQDFLEGYMAAKVRSTIYPLKEGDYFKLKDLNEKWPLGSQGVEVCCNLIRALPKKGALMEGEAAGDIWWMIQDVKKQRPLALEELEALWIKEPAFAIDEMRQQGLLSPSNSEAEEFKKRLLKESSVRYRLKDTQIFFESLKDRPDVSLLEYVKQDLIPRTKKANVHKAIDWLGLYVTEETERQGILQSWVPILLKHKKFCAALRLAETTSIDISKKEEGSDRPLGIPKEKEWYAALQKELGFKGALRWIEKCQLKDKAVWDESLPWIFRHRALKASGVANALFEMLADFYPEKITPTTMVGCQSVEHWLKVEKDDSALVVENKNDWRHVLEKSCLKASANITDEDAQLKKRRCL